MKLVATEGLDRMPAFTPVEALVICKRMTENGAKQCPHGNGMHRACGHLVACNYGFAALGFQTAASAWFGAPKKVKRHGLDKMLAAPAGALVFWTQGSLPDKAGHVGIADGKGNIFGTDLPDDSRFGRFPIEKVTDRFTLLEPVGWTFPFFGNAPSDNRRPPKLPGKAEDLAHERIAKRLIESAQDVIASAKRGLMLNPPPEFERAYRDLIKQAKQEIARVRGLQA